MNLPILGSAIVVVVALIGLTSPAQADNSDVLRSLKRALPAGTYRGVNMRGGPCPVVSDPFFAQGVGWVFNPAVGLSIIIENGGVEGSVRWDFDIRTADVQVA